MEHRAMGCRMDGDITLTLPLPPKSAHPNARPHWRAKASAVKAYRRTVRLLASASRPPEPYPSAEIALRWMFKDRRSRHDDDNLTAWFKAGRDGLADAGIVADDRNFRMLGHAVEFDGEPGVTVTIRAVKGA